MHATDAELVQLTLTGDKAAFGELVVRYQALIYGLAYHQVGNFTDAQDIAQEAFVKAFRCLDQLDQPERFAAWLKSVTANECKMWLRGSRRAVSLEEAGSLPSCVSAAAESWRRRERQAGIRRAVEALPERSRLMVTLYYLSGLSHREVGAFLGVAANAVAQHLHRARRQLKEILMAEIEEGYAMNILPEGFAQEVLGRVTLYPVEEGRVMTSLGEGDVRGMTLAVQETGHDKSFITLWMKQADLDDVVLGTITGRTAELPKGRALDTALDLLNAFGVKLEQVVLRLSDGRTCRAKAQLRQRRTDLAIDMRPSDAMGLAVRAKAPIYAEEAVIRAGNIGEGDVSLPDENMDTTAYTQEFRGLHQHDLLIDRALQMGLSAEDLIDTARFRQDKANGALRIWLEAIPEREITLDLAEYGPGVDMIFDLARRRGYTGQVKGDHIRGWNKRYKFLFSLLGDDARMRVVLEHDDAQPDCGTPQV